MPSSEFNVDLRDMRFALYETLPWSKLVDHFPSADHESTDLLLEECHRFHREVVSPIDRVGDRSGCQLVDGVVRMPDGFKHVYDAICNNGWLSVQLPETAGGLGLPFTLTMAVGEMQCGACCSLSLGVGLTNAAVSLLLAHASEELRNAYVANMVSGKWQGTMCLTEPHAGSAVGDIATKAQPHGDHWVIQGTKIFITFGEHDMCENHVHLVLARTPDAPKGFRGVSLFLVPKYRLKPDGTPGEFNNVVCSRVEEKMGIHASPTCVMQFGDSGPCHAWMIGQEGRGLHQMFHMMNHARLGVGMQGLALASQAFLYARGYAQERVQGVDIENLKDPDAPRVTIANHPNVRRMLLWAKANVEGMRALLYTTAFHSDLADVTTDEQQKKRYQGLHELLTPVCKAYISDQGFEVTRMAMQVLGGYGYVAEYPVERFMRDVKIASIYEGTNGIQALDLIGRKLPADNGAHFNNLVNQIETFCDEMQSHPLLATEMTALRKGVEPWKASTFVLSERGLSGDKKFPALVAPPYLKMTGNTVIGWLLARQATQAFDLLNQLYCEHNVFDASERSTFDQNNAEALFLKNKLETARFFIFNVLPENFAIEQQIRSGDRSALNYLP